MNKFVPYDKMSKKNKKIYDNEERYFFSRNVTTIPHKSVKDYIENGFLTLPKGC